MLHATVMNDEQQFMQLLFPHDIKEINTFLLLPSPGTFVLLVHTAQTLPHIPMTIRIYTIGDLHYACSVWLFIVQHSPFPSNSPN